MRKLLLTATAVLALTVGEKANAQFVGGGAVFCTNCVTPAFQLPEWLQNFENQVNMIEQQIQMVHYQINFWTTLVQNTIDLPFRIFADITGEIQRLQNIVQQAELIGSHAKFMIDHLGDPSGFGGSLDDIPLALAQENNALAYAMQTMGVGIRSSQTMQEFYVAQINTLQAQAPQGITQAIQIGNQIQATQAQQQAVYMNAQTVAFQALATAELRKAHRETLLDTRALLDQENAVAAECGYIANFQPPVCSAPMPQIPGGGSVAPAAATASTTVAPAG